MVADNQTADNARYEYELNPREEGIHESIMSNFENWLQDCGQKPQKDKPLAEDTAENYVSRINKYYRLVWQEEERYTSYLSHAHADTVAEKLDEDEIRRKDGKEYAESTKRRDVDSLVKYFYWLHDTQDREPWEPDVDFDEKTYNHPDYFKKDERKRLRDAVLDYKSVPAYNDLTPDERDRWKAHIAQRRGKPKSEVSPDDWEYLNTNYKWVSLLWVSLDAGLRPCEVERSETSWFRKSKDALHILKEESAKNRDNWEIALRDRTCHALKKWLRQRKNIAKYDDSDALWLNRKGNPFKSGPLNYFLDNLLEKIGLEDENRDLKWYSIRHSTGTYLETQMGLSATANQLRHKNLETTRTYTHTPVEYRQKGLEGI